MRARVAADDCSVIDTTVALLLPSSMYEYRHEGGKAEGEQSLRAPAETPPPRAGRRPIE